MSSSTNQIGDGMAVRGKVSSLAWQLAVKTFDAVVHLQQSRGLNA